MYFSRLIAGGRPDVSKAGHCHSTEATATGQRKLEGRMEGKSEGGHPKKTGRGGQSPPAKGENTSKVYYCPPKWGNTLF